MTRTWTVCRQLSPRRDGDRRWDQAYQQLVRWAERDGQPTVRSWLTDATSELALPAAPEPDNQLPGTHVVTYTTTRDAIRGKRQRSRT